MSVTLSLNGLSFFVVSLPFLVFPRFVKGWSMKFGLISNEARKKNVEVMVKLRRAGRKGRMFVELHQHFVRVVNQLGTDSICSFKTWGVLVLVEGYIN